MAEEDEEPWIQSTCDLLANIIEMPNHSRRYLKRPPVGFIHFIMVEVIRVTNFAEGLFCEEEKSVAYLSDRESRLRFVEKAIQCVRLALGEDLDISAKKVICGLEADKTSGWLRKLHQAATTCSRSTSDEAVKKVLRMQKISGAQEQAGPQEVRSLESRGFVGNELAMGATKSETVPPRAQSLSKPRDSDTQQRRRPVPLEDPSSCVAAACRAAAERASPSRPSSTKSKLQHARSWAGLWEPGIENAARQVSSFSSAVPSSPTSSLVVSGCQHPELGHKIHGTYVPSGTYHGKVSYRREQRGGKADMDTQEAYLYFWEDTSAPDFNGWWLGPEVGAESGWGFVPDEGGESLRPPSAGWRVPWHDATADPSMKVVEAAPVAASVVAPAAAPAAPPAVRYGGAPLADLDFEEEFEEEVDEWCAQPAAAQRGLLIAEQLAELSRRCHLLEAQLAKSEAQRRGAEEKVTTMTEKLRRCEEELELRTRAEERAQRETEESEAKCRSLEEQRRKADERWSQLERLLGAQREDVDRSIDGTVRAASDASLKAATERSDDAELFTVVVMRDSMDATGYSVQPTGEACICSLDPRFEGLRPMQVGDVIHAVDGRIVNGFDEYRQEAYHKKEFLLTLRRLADSNGVSPTKVNMTNFSTMTSIGIADLSSHGIGRSLGSGSRLESSTSLGSSTRQGSGPVLHNGGSPEHGGPGLQKAVAGSPLSASQIPLLPLAELAERTQRRAPPVPKPPQARLRR